MYGVAMNLVVLFQGAVTVAVWRLKLPNAA
jgi:hypothetical protein